MLDTRIEALTERYASLRALWRVPRAGDDLDWDGAGVLDLDAGKCVSQHYALSHLMLAAGLLRELTGSGEYGEDAAVMAGLFARQQAAAFAPYDENTIHWDFNNCAYLNCALLPGRGDIATRLRSPELDGLGRENGTWAGNWLVMRAVNHALRQQLGVPRRNWQRLPESYLRRRLFRADGGIDEFPGRSRPIQYHAYILALLLRRLLVTGRISRRDERRLRAGTEFLLAHVDAEGNANYRGRGQYQLFFEGCARYVLELMGTWHGGSGGDDACAAALASLDRQDWPQRPDGLLSLVRTDPDSERTGSHYDYHFVTVYNAFDLAWRLLAEYDQRRAGQLPRPRFPAPRLREGLFPDSGIFFARPAGWLLAIAAGEEMYLSDVGLSVSHLGGPRGVLFSAPGGPHPSRYGREHGSERLRENVFSPLIWDGQDRSLPHFARGRLRLDGPEVVVEVARDAWRLRRRLSVAGASLRFRDELWSQGDLPVRRIFHWAVPARLSLVSISDGTYSVRDRQTAAILATLCLEGVRGDALQWGEAFRGPAGVVRPCWLPARATNDTLTFTLELQP